MQKNINVKNVKEHVKKIKIQKKNYKVTSNRNVNKENNKPNKEKIYKSSKFIKMCIEIYKKYIYTNMKIYKYIEMHVEKYLNHKRVYKKQKV